jgi:C_GCAxxG_C_C family probable redox protein
LALSANEDIYGDCKKYYLDFNNHFGTSKCRYITGVRFKEGYDIRRFFIKGIICLKVVYTSIASVFNVIQSPKKNSVFTEKGFDCAKAVLLKVNSETGIAMSPLFKITPGLSGGLAGCGDICGALVGGALALGMVYGKEIDKRRPFTLIKAGMVALKEGSAIFEKEELHPCFTTSFRVSHLYRAFINKFGSADCRDILPQGRINIEEIGLCKEVICTVGQWTSELSHK